MKSRLLYYGKPFVIALSWGVCLGGITLWAVFQGLLLPRVNGYLPPWVVSTESLRLALYYVLIASASAIASIVLADFGQAVGGFVVAYLTAFGMTYEVISFPGATSPDVLFRNGLTIGAADWTFRALFPFPIFVVLIGTVIGLVLEERIHR